MFRLSFPKFKSMEAFQRAAETLQKMGDAANAELAAWHINPYFNPRPTKKEMGINPDFMPNINEQENLIRITPEPHYFGYWMIQIKLGERRRLIQPQFEDDPNAHIKSFYRHEELAENAVEANFEGARTLMDVIRATGACRASQHFTKDACDKMAEEAIQKSADLVNPERNIKQHRGL